MNSSRRGLRSIGLLISSLLLGSAAVAQESEISPWYFPLSLGGSQISETDTTDIELGYHLAGAIGRTILDGERFDLGLEGELAYTQSSFEDIEGDATILGVFGNAALDWRVYRNFGLYAVGGAGWLDVDAGSDDNQDFGFQIKAGVRYRLGETYAVALGYKYWSVEETTLTDSDVHTFELGVTWNLFRPRITR